MVENGELLEWAQVFGNRYGTPRLPVEAALAQGRDVLFDIDWQGTQQLEKAGRDLVSIFVLPPSIPDLEQRLRTRAQDSDEVIRRRLKNAQEELAHQDEFKYRIINKDFDTARQQLAAIIRSERTKA